METIKPPPPTPCPQKVKPVKKQKKIIKAKKSKIQQPSTPKPLSPMTKSDKQDDPKRKLYNLYEDFQNYDHKRTDAEIRMAQQKQIEILRDILVKGFAVKNLNSLHKNLINPVEKMKSVSKVQDRGDGNKDVPSVKVKTNSRIVNTVPKKFKSVKKLSSKKN